MATFGIDKLDYSNKYQNSYLETGMLTPLQARSVLKSVLKIIADYAATLPASCELAFKYKKAYEASWTALTSITDTKLVQERVEATIPEIAAFQLRVEFTVNSNDAPSIEKLSYEINK